MSVLEVIGAATLITVLGGFFALFIYGLWSLVRMESWGPWEDGDED